MSALEPLGDRAWIARFASEVEAVAWASAVRAARWPGITDVVVAFCAVGVHADPALGPLEELEALLRGLTAEIREDVAVGTLRTIPVLYDGDDLAEVAIATGVSPARVIALHSEHEYRVLAIGFQPGFPYAGPLCDALTGLSRRTSPRPRVPAGSVAIVGDQTAIYPRESPGGWHLLGRTPLQIVDVERGVFPLRAGDRLRFEAIDASEYSRRCGELLEMPPKSLVSRS